MPVSECIVCREEQEMMTVGACEHPFVCLECCFKCRALNKSTRCIYCNQELETVAVVRGPDHPFANIPQNNLIRFGYGIFATDDPTLRACYSLESARCPIPRCNKTLNDRSALIRHVKEAHKRFFCELCLEHRALLLTEQKVYRSEELQHHLDDGDCDAEGNLIAFHPYCSFCKRYFFNEELFLAHLRKEHLKCHLCTGDPTKHVFYDRYENLAIHLNMSHYACNQPACLEKCFVAFKTQAELDRHFNSAHSALGGKKSTKVLSLGKYVEESERQIVDKEGIDFSSSVR